MPVIKAQFSRAAGTGYVIETRHYVTDTQLEALFGDVVGGVYRDIPATSQVKQLLITLTADTIRGYRGDAEELNAGVRLKFANDADTQDFWEFSSGELNDLLTDACVELYGSDFYLMQLQGSIPLDDDEYDDEHRIIATWPWFGDPLRVSTLDNMIDRAYVLAAEDMSEGEVNIQALVYGSNIRVTGYRTLYLYMEEVHEAISRRLEGRRSTRATARVVPMVSSEEPEDIPLVVESTSTRRFGIEIEFATDRHTLSTVGRAAEAMLDRLGGRFPVAVTGYDHSHGSSWHFKTDSSCGFELASPILTWADWREFEAVLAVIREHGVVTDRCGLHVHHDLSDFTPMHMRRLLLLWSSMEQAIMTLVAPSRATNQYCASLRSCYTTFEALRDDLLPVDQVRNVVNNLGKYRSLNCLNWWRNQTVEVRVHHGTLHPNAIRFWVAVTQQIIELALQDTVDFEELEQLYGSSVQQQFEALTKKLPNPILNQSMKLAANKRNPALITAGA